MKGKAITISSLALIPLLLVSFVPLSANAQQPNSMLQYIETVYAHSGTQVKSTSLPIGTVTWTLTVTHHGNTANVDETLVIAAKDGSSETDPNSFTITDQSTPGNPAYSVYVPSLKQTMTYSTVQDSPLSPFSVPVYLHTTFFIGATGGGGSDSTSNCGHTWSLNAWAPPLSASYSGLWGFWLNCVGPPEAFFIGDLQLSDTSGFYSDNWVANPSGGQSTTDYNLIVTATVTMHWYYHPPF